MISSLMGLLKTRDRTIGRLCPGIVSSGLSWALSLRALSGLCLSWGLLDTDAESGGRGDASPCLKISGGRPPEIRVFQ